MWAALYILRVSNYNSVNEVNENQLDFLVDQTCKKCIKMTMEKSRLKEKGLGEKKNKRTKREKETTAEEMWMKRTKKKEKFDYGIIFTFTGNDKYVGRGILSPTYYH